MLFFVQNEPPHQLFKGHEVAAMLKSELRKQKADFLIFRALEINTVSESWEARSKALRQTTFHPEGDSYPRAHRPLTVLRNCEPEEENTCIFILSSLASKFTITLSFEGRQH